VRSIPGHRLVAGMHHPRFQRLRPHPGDGVPDTTSTTPES
jgi:hypothetical protein